jgi:hypothetical protein
MPGKRPKLIHCSMSFLTNLIAKGISKLYVKQWVIGLAYGDIKEIIHFGLLKKNGC